MRSWMWWRISLALGWEWRWIPYFERWWDGGFLIVWGPAWLKFTGWYKRDDTRVCQP